MPIKRRSDASDGASQNTGMSLGGRLTYGERTKDKDFSGSLDVRSTAILIRGHSVLETFNQDNQRYYDRKGSDLTLVLDVSAEQLLELSRDLAVAALKRLKTETLTAESAYHLEREKRIELEAQVEALKKAFKAGA